MSTRSRVRLGLWVLGLLAAGCCWFGAAERPAGEPGLSVAEMLGPGELRPGEVLRPPSAEVEAMLGPAK